MAGNYSPPTLNELQQYNPNVNNTVEAIRWSFYDSLQYGTAGQTQLQFFQVPKGQNGKTYADTNMLAAGILPSPQAFLIDSIQLYFFPGAAVSQHGAAAAENFVNDTYLFWSSKSWLELYIGSKAYLDEAPLMRFPGRSGLSGFAGMSDTTTAGAGQFNSVAYATAAGPVFEMNPPILIPPTQNFNITLNWPALVPISTNSQVYCHLEGWLYRNSQ